MTRTIDALEAFFSERYYEVTFPHDSINKAVAKTTKKQEGIYFECAKMVLTSQKDSHNLLDNDEAFFELADFYRTIRFKISSCFKFHLSVGFSGYTNINGFIKEFTTKALEENKNGFYRAVIITTEDFAITGYFDSNNSLKVGSIIYGSGVFEITIWNMQLHLFSYSDKITKRKYFIIESRSKVEYEKFASILDEIVLSITYLTGIFLGNEIYILSSESEDFSKENEIIALKSFFDDLKTNIPAIPDLNLQHDVHVKVQRIQSIYLERLILELYSSLIYKRTILLICQAHSEPHYVKSTLYSVALETITNIIAEKIEEKINPISDKPLAKKIREKLKAALTEFKELISNEAFKKIEADIDRTNSPTNKKKLLAPFEYFNIRLPEKDIEAIEKRNDFLHGRIPESSNKHYLALINGRLLFCINCLVLKQIDYSGYVMYHPIIYQRNNKLKIEEYPIRKI